MVRTEKGFSNPYAGADAIKTFRKYREEGQFFVYVGRAVEVVITDLKDRGIMADTKQVSHKIADLQGFVKRLIFE